MWSIYQNGEELFKTKSGKLEKCTNPSGCTRHVHPPVTDGKSAAAKVAAQIAAQSSANDEAVASLDAAMSHFEQNKAYEFKKVNFHYTCPTCKTIFNPVKTEEEMDSQVDAHDCENLTNAEMHQRRKRIMRDGGTLAWYDGIDFKPKHAECVSYQTSCTKCAEEHEIQLYEFFSMDEMKMICRPDSLFARPDYSRTEDIGINGESYVITKPEVIGVLHDFPESQAWQYLNDKSGMQLELERKGINVSDHYDYENGVCKICGSKDLDAYCMNCWTPSGYLIESED
jgi:hypothetical protein